jgi:hypothetical protein
LFAAYGVLYVLIAHPLSNFKRNIYKINKVTLITNIEAFAFCHIISNLHVSKPKTHYFFLPYCYGWGFIFGKSVNCAYFLLLPGSIYKP